jgi:peptidoglycan hydrolase-like protein with peptidoglycan-binding domain
MSEQTVDHFEEIARRAGAELRKPAPRDGLARVQIGLERRRRHHMVAADAATVAIVVGSLAVFGRGNQPNAPALTSPTTAEDKPETTDTTSTSAPSKLTIERSLTVGDTGEDVRRLQARLNELGFDVGPVDGVFGENTRAAVWAFQDLLRDPVKQPLRNADDSVTPGLWQRMQDPLGLNDWTPAATSRHVLISLQAQVLVVWNEGKIAAISHISTGSGKEWCTDPKNVPLWPNATTAFAEGGQPQKICGKSITPGGAFKVYRKSQGQLEVPLGTVFDPVFFNQGIAIHGFSDVPYEPASHGTVRVPLHIGKKLNDLLQVGDDVFVFDGIRDPDAYGPQPPLDDYPDPADPQRTAPPTATSSPTTATESNVSTRRQLGRTESGRLATFDATTGTLTVAGMPNSPITVDLSLRTTRPVDAPFGGENRPQLFAFGPDDVAYFLVDDAVPDASASAIAAPTTHVVAVSTDASNPGAIIARSPFDVVPEPNIMPTRFGLVASSPTSAKRPEPNAPMIQRWVDHQGREIERSKPSVTLNASATGALALTKDGGGRTTTFIVQDEPFPTYGIRPFVQTDDGGIIVYVENRLIRFAADGRKVMEIPAGDLVYMTLPDGTAYIPGTGNTFATIRI